MIDTENYIGQNLENLKEFSFKNVLFVFNIFSKELIMNKFDGSHFHYLGVFMWFSQNNIVWQI